MISTITRGRLRAPRRLLALTGATALAASALTWGASSASAAPATINPFAGNNGFGVVVRGDASLGNNELEGSLAAFGSVSATKGNYPLVHKVAGLGDFTVPSVDGEPVRMLAGSYEGTGGVAVTNAGATAGTAEADATLRLADVSNLTAANRGSWSRLSTLEGGVLDPERAAADLAPSAFASARPVADYFAGLDTHISQVNTCLTALYGTGGTGNAVTVTDRGGMAYPAGFATDRPNTIDYADVAGKTIKMDDAAGYEPTAAAPLIIKVAPGTTSLGKLEFWSAGGTGQAKASNMLLDLSALTGPVTIDGLEMGAIWGPDVDLTYDSNATTNGQYLVRSLTTRGAGELHQHTFRGEIPCAAAPALTPSIGTTVAVTGSSDKTLPLTGGTVVDTVSYENLTPGTEYLLTAKLMTTAGDDTSITATTTFTATAATGSVEVVLTLSAAQAASYAGQQLVVFEYLTAAGAPIAEHTDLTDARQTFSVAPKPTGPAPGNGSEQEPPGTEPGDDVDEQPAIPDGVVNVDTERDDTTLPDTGAAFSAAALFMALALSALGIALMRAKRSESR